MQFIFVWEFSYPNCTKDRLFIHNRTLVRNKFTCFSQETGQEIGPSVKLHFRYLQ